jgi:hypothetical protein
VQHNQKSLFGLGITKKFKTFDTNINVKLREIDSLIKKKSLTNTGVVLASENMPKQIRNLFPFVRTNFDTNDFVKIVHAAALNIIWKATIRGVSSSAL